jgi:hypothetical protein
VYYQQAPGPWHDRPTMFSRQQHKIWQLDSLLPVSKGFVRDPWLSIPFDLVSQIAIGSHWRVLDHFINHVLL